MATAGGDARIEVSDDLAEVLGGNGTALVGGIGIVVERHESVLCDNGFGPCYSFFAFFATKLCFLRHLDVSLTTLESGLLVQCLQQFLIGLEVDSLDADMPVFCLWIIIGILQCSPK